MARQGTAKNPGLLARNRPHTLDPQTHRQCAQTNLVVARLLKPETSEWLAGCAIKGGYTAHCGWRRIPTRLNIPPSQQVICILSARKTRLKRREITISCLNELHAIPCVEISGVTGKSPWDTYGPLQTQEGREYTNLGMYTISELIYKVSIAVSWD